MLQLMILMCILCMGHGNPFPQRSNPNFDSNFDFDDYLQQFQENPLDRTFDHPKLASNHDYRYTPLLGERPDYIPPILEKGHFPHPNIPRRHVVKHRAWHSSYQDGNIPHAGMHRAASGIRQQGHGEWRPHLKMQDFGDPEPPVVEALFKDGKHEIKNHHETPIVKKPSKGKPVFIKEHTEHPVIKPIINKDYETPEVVEVLYKKSKPIYNHAHKQIGVESITVKHGSYSEGYEEPVVEALTKEVLPHHNRKHGHKKPVLKHEKTTIVKSDQKHKVKVAEIAVPSDSEGYDTPVVVETFTKEKFPAGSKGHGHLKPIKAVPVVKNTKERPIFKPDWKPIVTSYPEDYEAPVVVEVMTRKESVPSKERGDKKHIVASPIKHVKNPIVKPIGKPDEPIYPDNYDLPVVEALTKKGTIHHKKKHGHKKTIELEVVVKHEKNPPIKPVVKPPVEPDYPDTYDLPVVVETYTTGTVHKKEHGYKKPIKPEVIVKYETNPPIKPPVETNYDTYELPIVVETYTKGTVHKKENGHKQSMEEELVVKHEKPAVQSYPGDYDLPIVVETFTKKTVHKEHGHKEPTEPELVVKHKKNPLMDPVKPPAEASYPDTYELPSVVETHSKGTAHKKEHGHKKTMEAELIVKHKTDTIVKPVEKHAVQSYPKDYDFPVVVEAYTKGTVHKKEHGHNKPSVSEVVTKKQDEKNPFVKPVKSSYADYEAPVVVETWTIPESVHNKRVKQSEEKPVWKKHSHEKVDKPIEELDDEEYEFEETRSEFDHKLKDYEYDDSLEIKDHILKEHGHKQVVERPPIKDLVTKTDNYEYQTKPTYQGNIEGSKITKRQTQWPKSQFKESEIKRTKRQAELDHEYDYDLPVVVEIETRPPQAASYKKPALMEPIDENDYDLPVVVEIETRSPQTFNHKITDFVKSAEYDYDHKKPEFVEPIDHEASYDFPEKVHPNVKIDEVYDLINAKKSKTDQDDNEEHEDINVEALTKGKRGNKKHGHKHSHKHVEKKVTKRPHVSEMPSKEQIVITNKREHKNPQMYLPTSVEPNVRDDGYERPIVKHTDVNMHEHKIDEPEKPGDFIEEVNSISKENPIHDSFEPMDISDTEDIVDSISINREGPDGREIPVLDVLAVDHANDLDAGLKVMTFNKENGKVDLINIGHKESNLGIDRFEEDSNPGIDNFDDSGSGVDLDERSSGPRSFIPMNSNTWSFMTHVQAQERRNFKRCSTPKNETGNCMPIQMCPIPNAGGTIDEFLRNVCIIDEVFIGVCCPEFPVQSVRVDWGQLGHSNSEPLIDNIQTSRESIECGRLPASFQNEDSWPWMAPLISTTSDRVFCGGALINEQYVLTAAHCTSRIPRNRILVRLGSPESQTGGVEFAIVEIKRHAHYNPKTMQNDIALLKLSRRVQLGNFRRPVCIPDGDMEDSVGETAVLLRWQKNSGSGVESLPVISNQGCQNRLGTLIGDTVLCTEPRNEETTCNADSGAPLVVNVDGKFSIIGVLTWNRNDCDGRLPSVFTKISSYRKWIRNHAK